MKKFNSEKEAMKWVKDNNMSYIKKSAHSTADQNRDWWIVEDYDDRIFTWTITYPLNKK